MDLLTSLKSSLKCLIVCEKIQNVQKCVLVGWRTQNVLAVIILAISNYGLEKNLEGNAWDIGLNQDHPHMQYECV